MPLLASGLRLAFLLACLTGWPTTPACSKKAVKSLVEAVEDHKEFKKLLRTKTNVLVLFSASEKKSADIVKVMEEASVEVKGLATLLTVDCACKEGKKLCKKLKVEAKDSYVLKHYKDGEFHKDYDRAETLKSMVTFLKDPTGELPWDEDPAASAVAHLTSPAQFNRFFKNEKGRVLAMFYAPWCGHCKRLKPDYQVAASELKGKAVLAAMDVNRPENSVISRRFNITGFPTLLYFDQGELQYPYPGENKKEAIKKFLEDPKPDVQEKPKEVAWSEEPSEVVHLTDLTFDEFMAREKSVLVMFYAPWCGHCKRAKPHFVSAAAKMVKEDIPGKLAAVDCTSESELGKRFQIKGFPTIKYFKDGEVAFDAGEAREEATILKLMRDPSEPPAPPPPEKAWADEETAVLHLTEETFKPVLKKKKHVLVIFYAPWCGHCKKAKPEFTAAAAEMADNPKVAFAAVDCTLERSVCTAYNVGGFPTFKYFSYYNKEQKDYDGGRTSKDFVRFMSDPQSPTAGQAPPPPSPEEEWAGLDGSLYLKHLRSSEFEEYLRFKDTVLVMFYAPWCGHCKAMKPEYARAAKQLTEEGVSHVLATVDATQERELGNKFDIQGYPTIKFFRRGKAVEDYSGGRKAADFVRYVRDKAAELRNEL